jgi:hypothetical protein
MLVPKKRPKCCMVKGCGNPVNAKGLCVGHGYQMQKYGYTWIKRRPKRCSIEGCGRPHHAKGMCKTHHERFRINGRINRAYPMGPRKCSIRGCGKPHFAKDLCRNHYNAAWRKKQKAKQKAK